MKRHIGIILLLATRVFSQTPTTQPAPSVQLSAGELSATVYLPDPQTGHYRGTRFDWSGMVGELRLGKDVFWNEWNPSPNATGDHDNAVGPAMEFGMDAPIGYDSATVGGGFVKIGVGVLERATTKPYFFRGQYRVLDPGVWKVMPDARGREVTFVHSLRLGQIAYVYEKRVALTDDRSLLIACRLWNTGEQSFGTSVYAHNFYRLGDRGWMSGATLRFDRPVKQAANAKGVGAVSFDAQGLTANELKPGQSAWIPLDYDADNPPRAYTLTCDTLQLAVSLDFAPTRLVVYGLPEMMCVEPFKEIKLEPGAVAEWSYAYQFDRVAPESPQLQTR